MKKKIRLSCITMMLLTFMILTGCGGASKESADYYAAPAEEAVAYEYDNDLYLTESAVTEEAMEEAEAETGGVDVKETTRKLIKTVDLEAETENFDALLKTVNEKTEKLGGYVESSYVYNGSQYYEHNRNANLKLRIPAEKLNDFLSSMDENSNITSKNENVEDVTLQYVDMKSHKEALETEQTRLLELLEQAETVEDIITIEGRLSEVRYQIESMESQLRTLDNQVSYSTVHLYIEEVKRYTPVKEQTVFEKITTGFVASLYDVGEGIADFFISFIIHIPYIVVWAVAIILVLIVVRKIRKKNAKKKMNKILQQTEREQASAMSESREKEDK